MAKLYVISVSGGAPSAWCAIWAKENLPEGEVLLLFADTLAEHEDNYRFLLDLEAYTNLEIMRLTDGRTPLEVGWDENYIPTQAFATCTFRLKTELIMKTVKELQAQGNEVEMIIGYDLTDKDRVAKTVENWAKLGIKARFPIIETNTKDPHGEVENKHGLKLPITYSMGFKHANCLGKNMGGCVKFGKKDTMIVIDKMPERHAVKELFEKKMLTRRRLQYMIVWNAYIKICPNLIATLKRMSFYTFLRDATGQYPDGLTLEQFRLNYQATKLQDTKVQQIFTLEADLSGCTTECGVNALENFDDKERLAPA